MELEEVRLKIVEEKMDGISKKLGNFKENYDTEKRMEEERRIE